MLAGCVGAMALCGAGAGPTSASKPVDVKSLPVNQWAKLPCKAEAGYIWGAPVYVPSRRQLLHWGGTERVSRNDVRAFDLAAGDWASDYPSDSKTGAGVTGVQGWGYMLPSGRPAPSAVINGVCYDSKRDRVVYTMRHLMVAYDPKAKTWQNLGAKTGMPYPVYDHDWIKNVAVMKTEIPGGPPVYGVGTCYDPENDEILLFPHFDAKNVSLRDATGQITGHYGTFRYRFADNTWLVVSDTFGSEEVQKARKDLVAVMAKASAAMDAAWVLNRKPDAAKAGEAAAQLERAATEMEGMALPADAKGGLAPVAALLKTAAAALSGGKAGEAATPLRDALWAMNEALDGPLRVEPPARCAAPMVYDPKNKCIVMFGGQTNIARTDIGAGLAYSGLDDTWLYDAKTRQWREIAKANRPPRTRIPLLAYDPESGLVLLVTLGSRPVKAALWTLDVAKGEWSKRDEQPWPGEIVTRGGGGSEYPHSGMPAYMGGFDAAARLFLILQPEKDGQATYAMKLDLGKVPAEPAPAWTPTPPIKPYEFSLADDPAWVEKLKALPANTWVAAKPAREPARRDWGTLSVDPARGCIVYFGGGHASYQCNDVSVYSVGGNKWVTGVGEHNAFVPPNEWEGSTLGHRGGLPTGHQRNTYQTFDGRMYVILGSDDVMPRNYMFHGEKDYVRFYDLDRGGVWRDVKIAHIDRPEKATTDLSVQMTDPRGRIMNLGANFRCYDVNEDTLTVKEVAKPPDSFPKLRGLGESRPFCYLPDRDQVFLMSATPEDPTKGAGADPKSTPFKQITVLYDVKSNTYSELPAGKTPPVVPVADVEYAPTQKAVLAIVPVSVGGKTVDQQWIYSFEKSAWAMLPVQPGVTFQHPYGQMVWVAKYGVFVNFCGGTWVMRPDVSQVKLTE